MVEPPKKANLCMHENEHSIDKWIAMVHDVRLPGALAPPSKDNRLIVTHEFH